MRCRISIYSKEKCSKKEEAFQKLSEIFSGFTIEADEIEKDTLLLANIERAEIIITATNDDNTNLMIAQIAKKNI